MSKVIQTELNGRMVNIEVSEHNGIPYACVKDDYEPTLEFIWDIDGTCGIKSTYSKLKEDYEIVEVFLKGYLIRKNMTDKEILSNFSRPLKFERKEITYYRIWNHDLISYADESKETQDWMDKHIRVFNNKKYDD